MNIKEITPHIAAMYLGQKCGFAQGTVSRVFAGKFPAKSEILCAIADAIGCEIKIINSSEGGEKI